MARKRSKKRAGGSPRTPGTPASAASSDASPAPSTPRKNEERVDDILHVVSPGPAARSAAHTPASGTGDSWHDLPPVTLRQTPGGLVDTSDAATSPIVLDMTDAAARSGAVGSLTTVIAASSGELPAADKDVAWATSPAAGRIVSATYRAESVRGAVEHAVVALQRRWRERLRRARFSRPSPAAAIAIVRKTPPANDDGAESARSGSAARARISRRHTRVAVPAAAGGAPKAFDFDDVVDADRFPGAAGFHLVPRLVDGLFTGRSATVVAFDELQTAVGIGAMPSGSTMAQFRAHYYQAGGGLLRRTVVSILKRLAVQPVTCADPLCPTGLALSAFEIYNNEVVDLVTKARLVPREMREAREQYALPGLAFVNVDNIDLFEDTLMLCLVNARSRGGAQLSHVFFRLTILTGRETNTTDIAPVDDDVLLSLKAQPAAKRPVVAWSEPQNDDAGATAAAAEREAAGERLAQAEENRTTLVQFVIAAPAASQAMASATPRSTEQRFINSSIADLGIMIDVMAGAVSGKTFNWRANLFCALLRHSLKCGPDRSATFIVRASPAAHVATVALASGARRLADVAHIAAVASAAAATPAKRLPPAKRAAIEQEEERSTARQLDIARRRLDILSAVNGQLVHALAGGDGHGARVLAAIGAAPAAADGEDDDASSRAALAAALAQERDRAARAEAAAARHKQRMVKIEARFAELSEAAKSMQDKVAEATAARDKMKRDAARRVEEVMRTAAEQNEKHRVAAEAQEKAAVAQNKKLEQLSARLIELVEERKQRKAAKKSGADGNAAADSKAHKGSKSSKSKAKSSAAPAKAAAPPATPTKGESAAGGTAGETPTRMDAEQLRRLVRQQQELIKQLELKYAAVSPKSLPRSDASTSSELAAAADVNLRPLLHWRREIGKQRDAVRADLDEFFERLRQAPTGKAVSLLKQRIADSLDTMDGHMGACLARLDELERNVFPLEASLRASPRGGQPGKATPGRARPRSAAPATPKRRPGAAAAVAAPGTPGTPGGPSDERNARQMVRTLSQVLQNTLEEHVGDFQAVLRQVRTYVDARRPSASADDSVMPSANLDILARLIDGMTQDIDKIVAQTASDDAAPVDELVSLITLTNHLNLLLTDQHSMLSQFYMLLTASLPPDADYSGSARTAARRISVGSVSSLSDG